MRRREFGRNVQPEQRTFQGRNGADNATERQVRQGRQIQPGNSFYRKIRIEIPEVTS